MQVKAETIYVGSIIESLTIFSLQLKKSIKRFFNSVSIFEIYDFADKFQTEKNVFLNTEKPDDPKTINKLMIKITNSAAEL